MRALSDAAPGSARRPTEPVWVRSLLKALSSLWRHGALTVIGPDGAVRSVGTPADGASAEPVPVWRVRRWRAVSRMITRGDIGFAEGYMAGDWDTPDLTGLLLAFAANYDALERIMGGSWAGRGFNLIRHALSRNSRRGSRHNILAHYDLGNGFYSQWLDPGMTYSAALFEPPGLSLEAAQTAKYAALARAADIRPGQTVLEIGCGWGGFAEYLAREQGVRVTAITLSPSQKAWAERRIADRGLSDSVSVKLIDYRDVQGRFDRIVSVEMFEAVGEAYWPTFFRRIRALLQPDGIAALQVITIRDDLFAAYRRRPDFIQLHVFPGGMLPSEPALLERAGQAGLSGQVVRRFGLDYAETLNRWRTAFEARDPRLTPDLDERFRRLWQYYLSYCEAGFRSGRTDVVHVRVA